MVVFPLKQVRLSLVFTGLALLTITGFAQTSLVIDASNSPYYFPNGHTVQPGDTLIFGPGAVVYVGDSMDIKVLGYFRSKGTEIQPVVIRPINSPVGWGALDITPSADSLVMTHTIVEDGRIYVNQCPTYLFHVDLINNQPLIWTDILIRVWFAHPVIDHCSISGTNRGEGITCHDCITPEITNCAFSKIPDAIEMINTNGGRIANSVFHDMYDDAIDLNNCSGVHIDSNRIYNVSDRGMEIGSETFGSCDSIVVTRNVVYNCPEAINFKEGSTGRIENNTLYGNGYGVKTLSAAGFGQERVEIQNCIFAENSENIWVDENAVVSASYCSFSQNAFEGTGNFVADPMFVAPNLFDFSLSEGSPCINTGNPVSTNDPDGSQNDLGAICRQNALLNNYADVLHIWPVPSEDRIYMRFPEEVETIRIFDPLGQLVHESNVSGDLLFIFNLSQLSPGSYYVQLTQNGIILTGSFIVV